MTPFERSNPEVGAGGGPRDTTLTDQPSGLMSNGMRPAENARSRNAAKKAIAPGERSHGDAVVDSRDVVGHAPTSPSTTALAPPRASAATAPPPARRPTRPGRQRQTSTSRPSLDLPQVH